MVELERSRKDFVLKRAGLADMDKSAGMSFKNPEFKRTGEIRRCAESAGITTRQAVTAVAGNDVMVRSFSFPELPSDELEGAVRLEASQVCPFDIDDSSVTFQVLKRENNQIKGILVAASNGQIHEKQRDLSKSSLNMAMVDVEGLALLNCLDEIEGEVAAESSAILKVDSYYTNISLSDKEGVPYVRDIPLAGLDILNQIANRNGISKETARMIWVEGDDSDFGDDELESILAESSERLIKNINDTLKFYSSQKSIGQIERIYLCGSFAKVKGFAELLNARLGGEVVLWNPLSKLTCAAGDDVKELVEARGCEMAVATGLALRKI